MKCRQLAVVLLVFAAGCGGPDANPESPAAPSAENTAPAAASSRPPNFVILIGDDMGVETLPCYGVGSQTATTPTLDSLCAAGMRFDNFWAQPVCSPTRATILTGQYGFRNGVTVPTSPPNIDYRLAELPAGSPREFGSPPGRDAPAVGGGPRIDRAVPESELTNVRPGLPAGKYTLAQALTADESLGYQTAAVGKWHLADADNGVLDHPRLAGFQHYAGGFRAGGVESYFTWSKVVDGEMTDGQTGYVTSATVDDALGWLDRRDSARPWLLWVAFNAPHTPIGKPPEALLSEATNAALETAPEGRDSLPVYHAMIEAMDTEIGRLLQNLPAEERNNTYVLFLGDNGTESGLATAPFESGRAKGTVYQGGVNVPLIVTGPGIDNGATTAALANSVDLFATVLDLAGTSADPRLEGETLDAVSLRPVLEEASATVRDFAYADVRGRASGGPRNERAIRNARFKLYVSDQSGTTEFYDLENDPAEKNDLLQGDLDVLAQTNYDDLTARLEALLSSQ
ncbi:MAG: sulfatase-like hydrolase/transferase [Pseudomonadota bacterium]